MNTDFSQTGMTVERTFEGHLRFWGVVRDQDFASVRLDPIERRCLEGCQTPADLLLALEIVFRRMAEQGVLGPYPKPAAGEPG